MGNVSSELEGLGVLGGGNRRRTGLRSDGVPCHIPQTPAVCREGSGTVHLYSLPLLWVLCVNWGWDDRGRFWTALRDGVGRQEPHARSDFCGVPRERFCCLSVQGHSVREAVRV